NALNVSPNAVISIQFDRPLATATITPANFRVLGRQSGPVSGAYSFSNNNQTLTFTPAAGRRVAAGETVYVNLSHNVGAADGNVMRQGGYAWQFTIVTARATMQFNQIAVMSNRDNPNVNTHMYGALAADLNGDGFVDLTTVNEDSHDLRVTLNRADGTGLYGPFLVPPLPVGVEASPNEPGDFNNDGLMDIAVATSVSSSVWIALGRGDGTFNPPQEVA